MAEETDVWSRAGAWLPFSSSIIARFHIRGRKSVFFIGFVTGLTISLGSLATALILADVRAQRKRRRRFERRADRGQLQGDAGSSSKGGKRRAGHIDIRSGQIVKGVEGLIGETPLMRIESLSELTGCEILGKAEWLNPGGSPKDRVAKRILDDAEEEGLLHPNNGSCIFEGTVG
jgi:cysteine synthase A